MKLTNLHVHLRSVPNEKPRHHATAKIEVPGLGVVKIDNALSQETLARIEAEAVAALRVKLGQTLSGESVA